MLLKFLLDAAAEGGETTNPANTGCTTQQWIMYAILAALLIAFFVWTTLSSKKRQKQEQEKINSLKIGDRVKTIGGVCGFVVDINDDENTFTLETGYGDNKSYVKFDKAAIYQSASDTPETAETQAAPAEPFEEKKEEAPAEEPAEEKQEEVKEEKKKPKKKEDDGEVF